MRSKKNKRKSGGTGKRGADPRTGKGRSARLAGSKRAWLLAAATALLVVFLIMTISDLPTWLQSLSAVFKRNNDAVTRVDVGRNREPLPPPAQAEGTRQIVFADFLGSEACAECHPNEYRVWTTSTHGRAGGPPDRNIVISEFNGEALQFENALVRPIRASDRYEFTVESSHLPNQRFRVDAVIGGGYMSGGGTQSYFSEFPDGTLRFLPFDFARQENAWFCQLRKNNEWMPVKPDISLTDLLQWPPARVLGTEAGFSNCQNCHGSQIEVRFDTTEKRYRTTFKSLTINCESCHGPGKRHVALAKSGGIAQTSNIGMRALSTLSKEESLLICFQCHATKDPLKPGYLPGKELEQYYSLKMPILAQSPYLPDGRVRAFAYQQNHLASDCYLSGSMVCVDCHEPHSQNYRDINGKALSSKFDNGQCVGCHASKREKPESHSHHKPDSRGSLCTSCHMPYLQHQGIGSKIGFARSDHTIPIPRPQFDQRLGIENACSKCHSDKPVEWLQAKTVEWYGGLKPHKRLVEALQDTNLIVDRISASRLILSDSLQNPLAQFSALSYFTKTFLAPDMSFLEPEIVEQLKRLSENEDLDVKALALTSLHLAYGQDADVHTFLASQLRKLGNDEEAIRRRWAIAVDFIGYSYANKGELDRALACHRKALEILPGEPVALVNLGIALARKADLQGAIAAFRKAIESDPVYMNPYRNLANAYVQLGEIGRAIATLNQAIAIKPVDAEAHFFLANLYLQRNDKPFAIQSLEEGLRWAPQDAEARRVLENLLGESND